MSEETPTPVQENPGVPVKPVLLSLLAALAIAALVLVILLFAFRLKLGVWPGGVVQPTPETFAAPRLQLDARRELERTEAEGSRELDQEAKVAIEAAMRAVADRPDPYAPLMPMAEVPDSPGLRAMQAQKAAETAGPGRLTPARGDTSEAGGMVPPSGEGGGSVTPGLGAAAPRVPPAALRGTPGYQNPGARAQPEVTR